MVNSKHSIGRDMNFVMNNISALDIDIQLWSKSCHQKTQDSLGHDRPDWHKFGTCQLIFWDNDSHMSPAVTHSIEYHVFRQSLKPYRDPLTTKVVCGVPSKQACL